MYELLSNAQPRVLRIINNSKKNHRLSHAYLFTGPKGSYKKEMAKYFAMMLYCKEEIPCEKCASCKAILEGRHLNVYTVSPLGQSIKKEQIMALQEEFSKTSLIDGPRVYIIEDADLMSLGAANSLLKFIEEPTSEIYGILITEHIDNILPTIKSRSINITFDELNKEHLKRLLLKEGYNDLASEALAFLTNNCDEAKEIYNTNANDRVIGLLAAFSKKLKDKSPIGLFYRANDLLYDRNHMKLFLTLLEGYFRDIYEYKLKENILYFSSLKEDIMTISTYYSQEELLAFIKQILDLIKKLSYNVNMSLLFNRFLIDLKGGRI